MSHGTIGASHMLETATGDKTAAPAGVKPRARSHPMPGADEHIRQCPVTLSSVPHELKYPLGYILFINTSPFLRPDATPFVFISVDHPHIFYSLIWYSTNHCHLAAPLPCLQDERPACLPNSQLYLTVSQPEKAHMVSCSHHDRMSAADGNDLGLLQPTNYSRDLLL